MITQACLFLFTLAHANNSGYCVLQQTSWII